MADQVVYLVHKEVSDKYGTSKCVGASLSREKAEDMEKDVVTRFKCRTFVTAVTLDTIDDRMAYVHFDRK